MVISCPRYWFDCYFGQKSSCLCDLRSASPVGHNVWMLEKSSHGAFKSKLASIKQRHNSQDSNKKRDQRFSLCYTFSGFELCLPCDVTRGATPHPDACFALRRSEAPTASCLSFLTTCTVWVGTILRKVCKQMAKSIVTWVRETLLQLCLESCVKHKDVGFILELYHGH